MPLHEHFFYESLRFFNHSPYSERLSQDLYFDRSSPCAHEKYFQIFSCMSFKKMETLCSPLRSVKCTALHNVTFQESVVYKELRDEYRLFRIFRLVKSRSLWWAKHVTGIETDDRFIRNLEHLQKFWKLRKRRRRRRRRRKEGGWGRRKNGV
jgi:hypothetical protein